MTMASLGVVSYLHLDVPVVIQRPKDSEWFVLTSPSGFPLYVSGVGSDQDAIAEAEATLQLLAQTLVDELDPADWADTLAANRIGFEIAFRGPDQKLRVEAAAKP